MRVELRPAVAADLPALGIEALPHRIKAMTALIDGRPVGIGGLVFMPDGTAWASVSIKPEGRPYKAALLRAAKLVLADADRQGLHTIYATAEEGVAGAERLLEHLGFVRPRGRSKHWVRRR